MAADVLIPTRNLKGPAMTAKNASTLCEAPGKGGQAQISSRTDAQSRCADVFASRFQDECRGTHPKATLVTAQAVAP